ncbi:hypothetical protein [Pseudooctadecabacter jejudonensis]|uniref:Uncharacterized protein n=1 Tax=Pseudooctadecabacter jejudonensis TaxID=1391910 RepID=A0A1Y5SIQ4_9RHOB|nr:hypothetical protein [Pseudooctadecabacter jejudonensis]SLN41057.1 hypothetical protein PSJ8397_02051 [Pseudooctadecabacter jejudonensis]
MNPHTKSLRLLSDTLQTRKEDEEVLIDYYSRLRGIGQDLKGQMSTAYAQTGVGLSLGLAFDFGSFVCPGVHIDAALKAKGAGTAHGILTLHRGARVAWFADIKHPPLPPKNPSPADQAPIARTDWSTDRPYCLSFLRGSTWEYGIDGKVGVWAGFGDAGDVDETGAAIGGELDLGGMGVTTRLCDPVPSHYPSYNADLIKRDLNGIFKENAKNAAAAWLILVGKGRKLALGDGVPIHSTNFLARKMAAFRGAAGTPLQDVANVWDTHDTAFVSRSGGDALWSIGDMLASAADTLRNKRKLGKLRTKDLIADLEKAYERFDTLYQDAREKLDDLAASSRGKVAAPRGYQMTFLLKNAAHHRRNEAETHLKVLRRIRDMTHFNAIAKTAIKAREVPKCYLDVNVVEGHATASATAKIVLPQLGQKDSKIMPRAVAQIKGKCYKKRIGSRYQSFTPGHGRTLLNTQDSVVTYASKLVTETRALSGFGKGTTGKPTETEYNLVTMSYRTVTAQWFDDKGTESYKALPNGSGVTFGMSVLRSRIIDYTKACKALSPLSVNNKTALSKDQIALEEAMEAQLRISHRELRAAFRASPDTMLEDTDASDAFVIELSHAFEDPVGLTFVKKDFRVKNMFDLPLVQQLLAAKPGVRVKGIRPQVIRIRYRVQQDEDRTRGLFSLGWNPLVNLEEGKTRESVNPFSSQGNYDENLQEAEQFKSFDGFDPKKVKSPFTVVPEIAAQTSFDLTRVSRVGTECVISLHEYHIPPHYFPQDFGAERAASLTRMNAKRDAELLVPPVLLFSQ